MYRRGKVRVSGSICFVGAVTALLLMIGTNAVAATPRQQAEQALQQLAVSIKTAEAGKDWRPLFSAYLRLPEPREREQDNLV